MGVELVIERCCLAITASAVQGLRLLERAVGVRPQDMHRIFPRLFLQCLQNTSPEPETANRSFDPHALDFADLAGPDFQPPAAERFSIETRDDKTAGGGRQLGDACGARPARVVSVLEPTGQFTGELFESGDRGGAICGFDPNIDRGGA